MKLTTPSIALPEGKADAIFFDDALRGFGLRVRRGSGDRVIRNWIIQYRAHGHARRMIVGSAERLTAAQARDQARKLLAKVDLGGDPQAEKHERRERDSRSLRSVISDFLDYKGSAEARKVKEGTLRILRRYLEGPKLKPLHGMPIDRITRMDVQARVSAVLRESGAPSAIVFRSALSSLFVWAMEEHLIEVNPVIGSRKPPPQPSRERELSDQELALIWRSLRDDEYAKVAKLLILTGCRREEIAAMRRSEFDLDAGTWTLPATRSKNGKPHTLPITPLMERIINSIPRRERDILFGQKNGFTSWKFGKRALDQKLGLPAWTHHDIRRSVASRMGDIGIMPHIVEQILNHQSGTKRGVAGIYNKSVYANDVTAAMLRWSDHIEGLVEGGGRKVLSYKKPTVAAATL